MTVKLHAKDALGLAVSLPEPARMVCEQAFDVPADALEAVFPVTGLTAARELAELALELDGTEVFRGVVDEQLVRTDGDGVMMTVRARGMAAVLLDNEAIPQAFERPSLLDMYNAHLRQYGFRGLLYNRNAVLTSYGVAKGKSEWQAFEGFCRQALGVRPRVEDGYVTVRPRAPGRTFVLSNSGGLAYSALEVKIKRYGVISRVILKSAAGIYDTPVENRAAQLAGIRRKRYVSPSSEWGSNPNAGADRLMRDSMARRLQVTAVLTELADIRVGDRVRVNDGGWSFGELAVAGVTHRASGAGRETELILLSPEYVE